MAGKIGVTMAESTTTRMIRAPRAKIYATVSDIRALAGCLQPEGASSRILSYDEAGWRLRMEITHAPGPEGTRRFRLSILETRKDELVVYGAAFEGDPALAGEMKLHFILKETLGGTEVTVRHEGLPDSISVRDNEEGTAASLANLARLVEGGRS